MYIIIAGCGRVGSILVKRFSEEGHDVAVVDRDPGSFAQLGNGCNCMTIAGMPIDEDVLKEAGIEKADALAAVTADDNTNIMIAQIARQLYRVPGVFAEIDDPEQQRVLTAMGLRAICPAALTVDSFFKELLKGAAAQ